MAAGGDNVVSLRNIHLGRIIQRPSSLDKQFSVTPIVAISDACFLSLGAGLYLISKKHSVVHRRFCLANVSLPFLDASTHLYMRVCPSVGPSVAWFFLTAEIEWKQHNNIGDSIQ